MCFLFIQTALCEKTVFDNINEVILDWEPSDKSSDKFRVEYKKENESEYQELPNDKITQLTCIIETLPASTSGQDTSGNYEFKVAAIYKTGLKAFTNSVTEDSKLCNVDICIV